MGCGQNLLNQLVGTNADIKVGLDPQSAQQIKAGDFIEIGIEEGAIVAASMLAYGAPLLSLILSIIIADATGVTGIALAMSCILGMGFGILLAQLVLSSHFRPGFFQPIFVRKIFRSS